jgi:TolB-like protein
MRLATYLLLVVTLGFTATPLVRAEDSSVVVLGLRSLEGDDEFANSMTDALRDAARGVRGWRVLERAVSMAQMTLAHNCEDINVGCLSEIARGLQADRVVFGTVRRTAGRSKFDYEVTASLFNNSTHSTVGTETQTVARNDAKAPRMLASQAQFIMSHLASSDASSGRLTIEVNVLAAEVHMDGTLVGQTHDGKLNMESLAPGEHTLEVTAPGHDAHKEVVHVSGGDQSTVVVTLTRARQDSDVVASSPDSVPLDAPPQPERSSLAWLGYTLIGVGAASAIGWGASMYMIEFQYNRDLTYQEYKNHYKFMTGDACDLALRGENAGGALSAGQLADFQSRCRSGRTFQTLQWVFLGAAVLTAGLGAYVLISELGHDDGARAQAKRKPTPRLTFDPLFDRRSVALQATLRF